MACIKIIHKKPSGQNGEENKQNNALLSFATEQQALLFNSCSNIPIIYSNGKSRDITASEKF
jgi:hypothetical protein